MKLFKSIFLTASLLLSTSLFAGELEVLHWWTSGGEAKAVSSLKDTLSEKGHTWKDFSVAGGSGSNAMSALKSRAVAGNPPTAAQILGPALLEWAELGVLRNMDHVAKANNWDEVLPASFAKHMKYDGHYVAAPVNVHKANWMWVNPAIFKKAGATIPTTWEEFEVAAKKIKKAGFIPVAQGGQPWQEAHLFESIVLGVGGADFYKKAMVDSDLKALGSKTMRKAFDTFRMVKKYTDKNAPGRDWNLATAMVYKGEAAMQFMGDWAKGEFAIAKKSPGIDYVAYDIPATNGSFLYIIDAFMLFDIKDKNARKAQDDLAEAILSDKFQTTFNLYKGSVPVKGGVSRAPFDDVALRSMDQINGAAYTKQLHPSFAHGMATAPNIKGAMTDIITKFFNSNMSSKNGAKALVKAVKAEL